MPFRNRVRLPIFFAKPQFPMERDVFRKADGSSKVLSIVIRNTYEGKTDQLPEDWHRKLVIAMAHDEVSVEGERLLSDVVLDGDYGIDWQDFLNYPVAQATFTVQVTPFAATNNNCQTCEDLSQVVLVDDTTDDVWAEGTTNEFPDVLTDNDSICCHPYTITLSDWNTEYFSAVSISADGVLTATVKSPVPDITGIWIATYRVTCADGQYDEADVYGNISGASTDCAPIPQVTAVQVDSNSEQLIWDFPRPAPSCYHWQLFLTSDLGTPIQSGDVATGIYNHTVTGLTSGVSYTFSIVVDCACDGTNLSAPTTVEFELVEAPADTCGNFNIVKLNVFITHISYMDCVGNIVNETLVLPGTIERCMLIASGGTTPVYFVSDNPGTTATYTALC